MVLSYKRKSVSVHFPKEGHILYDDTFYNMCNVGIQQGKLIPTASVAKFFMYQLFISEADPEQLTRQITPPFATALAHGKLAFVQKNPTSCNQLDHLQKLAFKICINHISKNVLIVMRNVITFLSAAISGDTLQGETASSGALFILTLPFESVSAISLNTDLKPLQQYYFFTFIRIIT